MWQAKLGHDRNRRSPLFLGRRAQQTIAHCHLIVRQSSRVLNPPCLSKPPSSNILPASKRRWLQPRPMRGRRPVCRCCPFRPGRRSRPRHRRPALEIDRTQRNHRQTIRTRRRCWPRRASRPDRCWSSGSGDRANFDAGHGLSRRGRRHRSNSPASRATAWPFFSATARPRSTEAAVAGAIVGCQGQDLYRAEKKRTPLGELALGRRKPTRFATARFWARASISRGRLVNEPPRSDVSRIVRREGRRGCQSVRPGNRNLGQEAAWRASGAARCWRWPAVRIARRGW